MKNPYRFLAPTALCIMTGLMLTACGSVDFASKKATRQGASKEQLSSDFCVSNPQDVACISDKGLPIQTPGQYPGQYPNQYPGQFPGQFPGQVPCANNCSCEKGCAEPCSTPCGGEVYQPVPVSGKDYEPFPAQFPVSQNIVVDDCVKSGKICDVGQGPTQMPPVDVKGVAFDHGQASACFDHFRGNGVPTYGAWPVYGERVAAVNVLGVSTFVDQSVGPRVIMVNATNIIGGLRLVLGNPNALYCVNAVSIVGQIDVASCYSNNVIFTNDISILGGRAPGLMRCP